MLVTDVLLSGEEGAGDSRGSRGHSLVMVIVTQMDARLINFFSAMIWTIISLNAGNGYWSSFAGGQMGHNGVH